MQKVRRLHANRGPTTLATPAHMAEDPRADGAAPPLQEVRGAGRPLSCV